MKPGWMLMLLVTSACNDVRIDPDADPDSVGEHGDGEDAASEPASQPARAPRSCGVGAQLMVQETFTKAEWPQAWLPVDVGESWVEGGAGFLQAGPGESHGRALYRSFGDIDVAVRWLPSSEQGFRIALRGNVENSPPAIVMGHAVGATPRAQWLRARIWNELGTTRLEVHEWFDGEPEPEGWLRSVVGSAGPVGTFALQAVEQGGATPVRVEEVLICGLAVGSDV